MKRLIILLLALAVCCFSFMACKDKTEDKEPTDYRVETPSDTSNKDDDGSKPSDQEGQDEKGNADDKAQEDIKDTTGDKSEPDKSWSKDVEI